MMRYVTLVICLSVSIVIYGQSLPNRYQEDVFGSWIETSEIQFSTAVPQPNPGGGFYEFVTGYPVNVDEYDTSPVDLFMDIFEPQGDTLSMRPVIIICFGGGFVTGDKDYWSIRLLAQSLAKRGFVTATIDYRLGMNMFDADLTNRAVYRGVQDGRSAIRFFRADAAGDNTYKVDPNQIYISGHSAGAFIATHNAYLDKESERPLSTYEWVQDGYDCIDLGCLDCAGDNQEYDGSADAIFSLAGALGFVDYIETADDTRMVMFHSEDDGTVPYTNGAPFSDISWLLVGEDLPDVYGSSDMANQADLVGLEYSFLSYQNRGHGVHEDDPDLHDDIVPGIEDWFYLDRLKPKNVALVGDTVICNDDLYASYVSSAIDGGYYDWIIDGQSATVGTYEDNEIMINWDPLASIHTVSLLPYSDLRARGDSIHLQIEIQDVASNVWDKSTSDWTDPVKWSLGRIPRTCDEVILPTDNGYTLSIPEDVNSVVKRIISYPGATLDIKNGAVLTVKGGL